MTTHETSRAAYELLVASGQLKPRAAMIMDKLISLGSATSGEVLAALEIHNVNAWRARFTELQGRGLIVEHGTRPCRISGRECVVWRPTGRTKPLALRRGARDSLSARLKELGAIAARMAADLEGLNKHAASLADYRRIAGTKARR